MTNLSFTFFHLKTKCHVFKWWCYLLVHYLVLKWHEKSLHLLGFQINHLFAFLCRNWVFFNSHIVLIPRDFFVLSHPHLLSNDAASFVYTGDLQSQMIRGSMRKKTSSWSQNLARSTSQKNK